jgi:hypothetical protein
MDEICAISHHAHISYSINFLPAPLSGCTEKVRLNSIHSPSKFGNRLTLAILKVSLAEVSFGWTIPLLSHQPYILSCYPVKANM